MVGRSANVYLFDIQGNLLSALDKTFLISLDRLKGIDIQMIYMN